MTSPPTLSKGTAITLLSTARKVSKEEIAPTVSLLKKWKLKVRLGDNIFKEQHQFAGNVEERLADLQNALDDPECAAIICARGGYGTVQLIDHLDFSEFKKYPKWIVGYSDVTVLHAHLHQLVKCESIHGIMPINFPKDGSENSSLGSLKKVLFGEELNYNLPNNNPLNKMGEAEAELIGGNLSILYSLTGTVSCLDTKGKILFLEDLDEYLYHIDRMMMNLKRAGMLSNLAALVVGGMSSMNDNTIPFGMTAEKIIHEYVKEYDYPVLFDFPAGHLDENLALIMGRKAHLKVDKENFSLNFKYNG